MKKLIVGVTAGVILLGGAGFGVYKYLDVKDSKQEVTEKSKINTKTDVIMQKDIGEDVKVDNSSGYSPELQKKIDEGTEHMKNQESQRGNTIEQVSERYYNEFKKKPEFKEGDPYLFQGKISIPQFYIKDTGVSVCTSTDGEILAMFLDVADGELNNKYMKVVSGEDFSIDSGTEGTSIGAKLVNTSTWDIQQYNSKKYVVYKLNKGVDGLNGGFDF
ncbi:hypothetical protein COF68_04470 [Bacillus toyonensis]|uniref:hypothetical protein n=1 Tax=Bacillus toyonensis TaxID=155322 RepID=UPI000BFE057F|nr:hypothetical protein [Bacillus toyonensis]PHE64110.1 hypothetical protein COF68_04470 [Bacillus toyonensis]